MSFIPQRVYWSIQFFWWLFTTLILKQPTTKFFNDPYNKASYLLLNFLIGIMLSHVYTKVYQAKERNKSDVLIFPVVASILMGTCFFVVDYYYDFQGYRSFSVPSILVPFDYYQFFFESVRYSGVWFLFYHLIMSNRVAHHKELRLAQAEMSLKTAELENLKNQLNPHFLFNAINSIKALTIFDPELARKALTELSQLLRTSLSMGNQQLVPLEMELSLVRDYLFLEKIRYEKRLMYSFHIQNETLSLSIPPMSVPLLVENDIKHGIGRNKLGGKVKIISELKGEIFTIKVVNTGKLSQKISPVGVGMKNLERRLQINFQERATFTLEEEEDTVVASIIIRVNNSK